MANRCQINNRRTEGANPMARFSIGEDDEDAPIVNKRPRFSETASQSQSQRSVHRSRSPVVSEEDEDELIPLDDVDSDSQGFEEEEEEDDEGFEGEGEEGEEEGEDSGSEDEEDEEETAVAERQRQNQQVAYSQLRVRNLTVADTSLERCSSVVQVPVFNNASGALDVVLTDPDVLDCPICLEPLCSPIFQCENGHIACSSCCTKVNQKCPSCCMPIGYSRCRAIEKVIESLRVSCKNSKSGCKETMTYNKKIEHEQVCPHVTCFCPHPSCTFAAAFKMLYLHFGVQHAASTTRFTYNTPFSLRIDSNQKHSFLQEQHESVIFVLNHGVREYGKVFDVECVGPSTLKSRFVYQISVKSMDTLLSLQSVPEVHKKWLEHTPTKNYLTVPLAFSGINGMLSLHLCIKKAA